MKALDPRWLPRYAGLVYRTSLHHPELAGLFAPGAVLVPVPGSAPGSDAPWVALQLAVALRDVGRAGSVWPGLQRSFAVRKSATALSGERPTVCEHYQSFSVIQPPAVIRRIVLIDDVVTKGRTLLAAAARMQALFPHADIRAFAFIRTLGFERRVGHLLEPCQGVIRWAGGDARREP